MTGLDTGKLDRRITLRRQSVGFDAHNRPTQTLDDLATVSASWRRSSAGERLAANQVGASVTDIFEIRWSPAVEGVNPKDQVSYAGRDYDIVEVTEIGRREGLLIRAAARADT